LLKELEELFRSWAKSRQICHHRSIWSVRRHIASLLAWNGPLINLNPKHHLYIKHLCHSQRHLVFGKKWLPIMAMCTSNMIAFICSSTQLVYWAELLFLHTSCIESGHFLLMWHHCTYCEHNMYDQGWGRFCHPTFITMVGFSSVLSFASCHLLFVSWTLITFLCIICHHTYHLLINK
jgi:hypothetical protein